MKSRFMKFRLASAIVFFAAVLLAPNLHSACKFSILFVNEFKGAFKPSSNLGGAKELAGIINKIRVKNDKEGRDTVLFFVGGVMSDNASTFRGHEVEYMNLLGVQAAVLGGSDFAEGASAIKKVLKDAKFEVLAANVLDKGGERLFITPSYVMPITEYCKLGIVGVTSQKSGGSAGLTFENPVEYAKDYMDELVEQSDMQIALAYVPSGNARAIATGASGVDLVLSGGNNVSAPGACETVGKAVVCEAPPYGSYIGRVDVDIDSGVKIVNEEFIPVKGGTMWTPKPIKEWLKGLGI